MDSLDIPVGEEPSDDDHHYELPAVQGANDSVVGTVRGSDSHNKTKSGAIVADCGILDACGM
eukprot:4883596-Karenia_brevis.AAC.1